MSFDPTVPDKNPHSLGERFGNFRNHLAVTHDVWHTLTGIGTATMGEFELQAFLFAQVGRPIHLFSVGLGSWPQ